MSEIYQDADAEGLEGPSWWWPMRLYEGYGCHLRLLNQRNSQEQKTIPATKTAVDDRAETKTETLDSNKRGSAREEESQSSGGHVSSVVYNTTSFPLSAFNDGVVRGNPTRFYQFLIKIGSALVL
ncbi:hypothetical protein ACFX13_016317 [Malus domestica]